MKANRDRLEKCLIEICNDELAWLSTMLSKVVFTTERRDASNGSALSGTMTSADYRETQTANIPPPPPPLRVHIFCIENLETGTATLSS